MVTIVILVNAACKLKLVEKVACIYTHALQNSAKICVQRCYASVCQGEGVAAEMGFGFHHYVAFRAQSGTRYFGAAVGDLRLLSLTHTETTQEQQLCFLKTNLDLALPLLFLLNDPEPCITHSNNTILHRK